MNNRRPEIAIVSSAVPLATCTTWLALVDSVYDDIEATSQSDFVTESSSFRLGAISGLAVLDIWVALSSRARKACTDILGSRLAIDVDQCWVRRQDPKRFAPPRRIWSTSTSRKTIAARRARAMSPGLRRSTRSSRSITTAG